MQVRVGFRYAVAAIDSTTSIVMSQFQYLSYLSDFYRAPLGNDHLFLAITAVIKWTSNHETYRWTVHHSLSRMTNFTLLGYSINTTVKLHLQECQTCLILCYYVSCESCDEFLLSTVYYCDNVMVLSWTCCFSVPGYVYNHAKRLLFSNILFYYMCF